MNGDFTALKQNVNLLLELVRKGIRLKYRRSFFGIIWSLIEPLLTTAVLVIVFGTILGHRERSFVLYTLIGRLIYSYYSNTCKIACMSLCRESSTLRKISIPKILIPLSDVIWNYIVFVISLVVLIPVSFYSGISVSFLIWRIVPAIIILFMYTFGTGLILSICNTFFRDVEYLWNVAALIIMYISAIFYYPELLMNSRWGFVLAYNPLYWIIALFRSAFIETRIDQGNILYLIAFVGVQLIISLVWYNKVKDKLILYL